MDRSLLLALGRPMIFVMTPLLVIAMMVLSPTAATASRIDYDGQDGISGNFALDVWFDCGIACGNYFYDIKPGKSVSRPGKAGKVMAQTREIPMSKEMEGFCELTGDIPKISRVSVGAHGEVGVTFAGPRGSVKFVWVSKGGNSWTTPASHPASGGFGVREPCLWRGTP